MGIIYLLIGCSVLVAAAFLGLFFWSVKGGQYEDTQSPAFRVLFDELSEEPANAFESAAQEAAGSAAPSSTPLSANG